jgi:DNA-binding NarL/FixJ family response regulator
LLAYSENSFDLKEKLKSIQPDVLIIDPLSYGFYESDLTFLNVNYPSIKTITISAKPLKQNITYAIDNGVISCLLKECDQFEISEAIVATNKREKFFCSQIIEGILNDGTKTNSSLSISCEGVKVSTRELEIIKLVASGYSNKEIADKLFLSVHTVTTHRKNIMSKLGINNTAGLILFALKQNIIQYDQLSVN